MNPTKASEFPSTSCLELAAAQRASLLLSPTLLLAWAQLQDGTLFLMNYKINQNS